MNIVEDFLNMKKQKLVLGLALAATMFTMQSAWAAEKQELTLDDIVQRAFQNETRVGIAKSDVLSSKGALRQAWGANGLNISYNYNATRAVGHAAAGRVIGENYGSTVQAALPIYTGGANEGNIDRATSGLRAQEYSYDATMQQIKFDATNAYFTVLADRDTIKLQQETVDRYAAHLKDVKAQFEVGTVAKIDVLGSEVALANAKQNLTKAQRTYEVDRVALLNMLGLPADTEVSFNEQLKYETYDKTKDFCLSYALQNQPSIRIAAAKVKAALASMQVARAGYLPTVSVVATNSWSGKSFPGNTVKDDWTLSARASVPILDSGITAGKVDIARAAYDTAVEQQRQVIQAVHYNLTNAYLSLREAEQRINTAGVASAQAEENYRIAQLRYQAGVGTNLDLLDAALSLTNAKNNYVSALYAYNTSKSALDKAMGISTGMELAHRYDRKKPLPEPAVLRDKAYPNMSVVKPNYKNNTALLNKSNITTEDGVIENSFIKDFLSK